MVRPERFELSTPWFVDWSSFARNCMIALDFLARLL